MSQPSFAPAPLYFDRPSPDGNGTNRCVDWADYPALFQRPSREQKPTTVHADHQPPPLSHSGRDIHEAFLAFCQAMLWRPESAWYDRLNERSAATTALAAAESFGFTREEVRRLGCGLYPGSAAIREYLRGVGFSDREIESAALTCDATGRQRAELAGNLVVPLTDQHGRGRDYLLVAIDQGLRTFASYRHLFGSDSSGIVAYGLRSSLMPVRMENALVLVEDILECLLLQCRGIRNVASIGGNGRNFSPARWEALSGLGIEAVILAFRQDERHDRSVRDALVNALRARTTPEVYVADTYPAYEESLLDVLRRFDHHTCRRALAHRTLAFHQKDFRGTDGDAPSTEAAMPVAPWEFEPYYRTAFRRHLNDLISALPTEYQSVQSERLAAVDEAARAQEWGRLRRLVSGSNPAESTGRDRPCRNSHPSAAEVSDSMNDGNATSGRYRQPRVPERATLAEPRFHDFPASQAEIQSLLADWEQRELEDAGAI